MRNDLLITRALLQLELRDLEAVRQWFLASLSLTVMLVTALVL